MRHNLPEIQWTNLYTQDPLGKKFWERRLTPTLFAQVEAHFERMGRSGALATPLAAQADLKSPELLAYDSLGERQSEIVYDHSYQQLRELAYGQGIVSYKYHELAASAGLRARRHLIGFGAGYYFAQTETGLYCPICMTDALARVLMRHAPDHPQAQRTIERLTAKQNYWQAAMFLTERQGGSDVGANSVQAEQSGGRWFLRGHKWFCSNVDAEAILTLARMPGEEGALSRGTKGLGLFLILRDTPAGNHRSVEVQRLKRKLGVRSMASGEVILQNPEAFLIKGAGEGFKVMADMVNMSRLYNAVSSVAIAQRALLEAQAFGARRKAFGSRLLELPLWRSVMADLVAEHWALMHLVFEAVDQLDRADSGDAKATALSRVLTPLAKLLSGRFAVFAASECMEAIGGIAYIEESPLPRLLRDAQVLPIWEGTSNIQALDVLRAMGKEGLAPLWQRLRGIASLSSAQATRVAEPWLEQIKFMEDRLTAFAALDARQQAAQARWISEDLGRLVARLLLWESAQSAELREFSLAALNRLRGRPHFTAPPAGSASVTALEDEQILLSHAQDLGQAASGNPL